MTPPRTACLVFKAGATLISCGDAGLSIELVGEGLGHSEAQLVREAAVGVLHYFRSELGRESVTLDEFSTALTGVLRGFGLHIESWHREADAASPPESDLTRLLNDGGGTFELGFYQQLRAELDRQLEPRPRVVRFTGLRPCVKQLAGARRWSSRCQSLSDQIVEYVRRYLSEQSHAANCAVVVV